MHKKIIFILCFALCLTTLFGCKRIRTYTEEVERVDQDLSGGNRGYLQGTAPAIDESTRKKTRETFTIEVDLPPYYEVEETSMRSGQASYRKEAVAVEPQEIGVVEVEEGQIEMEAAQENYSEYVVQKDDTLQKISQKFYGTTRKWTEIYKANKDKLKSPDKVYPGQTLRIPEL